MLRSMLTAWRPVALAAVLLALVAAPVRVQAAGHSSGFHAGSYHAGSYHASGLHYGGYHTSGYRPGYFSGYRPGNVSGYHNAYGYDHRAYGYYSPSLYAPAYMSNSSALPPDFYYSPNYTTTAPDYGLPAYYTPDAAVPAPDVTATAPTAEATPGPATVDVHVPASAQVWFDDSTTKQTGNERKFASPPLPPGRDYTYDIRARWTDNGHVTDETRTVTVHANGLTSVDFTQPAPTVSASK